MKREIMMKVEQTVATAHVGVSLREACPVVDDEPAIAIVGRSVETLVSIKRKIINKPTFLRVGTWGSTIYWRFMMCKCVICGREGDGI